MSNISTRHRRFKTLRQILRLSWRDYAHEKLLSACAILGLAAVLTPLLVLYGVKFGVMQTLTDRLRSEPRTLEISPVVSGRFSMKYLDELAAHPDVAFVLPRTRSIAATMDLVSNQGSERATLLVSLEPTAEGDPLFQRYGAASPVMPVHPDKKAIGISLSATAAEKLHVSTGDTITGRVERRYSGQLQSVRVTLHVVSVLPLAAQQKDVAFIPLPLLEATEDYRDGRAVPELDTSQGWTGEARPQEPRLYPGFRLYAKNLDAVMRLRQGFAQQKLDVYTHAEEIEQINSLAHALNLVFALICAATAAGFLASTTSSTLASVKRKERTLGLLSLAGFTTGELMLLPLVQSLLTALVGTALASGLYALSALAINHLFSASLTGMEQVCRLLPQHFLLAFAAVAGLALAAALGPALRAARIEPSEVIREV